MLISYGTGCAKLGSETFRRDNLLSSSSLLLPIVHSVYGLLRFEYCAASMVLSDDEVLGIKYLMPGCYPAQRITYLNQIARHANMGHTHTL